MNTVSDVSSQRAAGESVQARLPQDPNPAVQDPLELLLQRLGVADRAAAEQVFQTYEPCLRMMVRRMLPGQLRPKFDSVDIVQSVWADIWRRVQRSGCHFQSAAQLRSFLIKATRNRFIDRIRQQGPILLRQQGLETNDRAVISKESMPQEVIEADELWQRMLDLCPAAHQEILKLKRQGHSLAEIAERTGYHPSSIRRILYDLARKLSSANP